MSVVSIAHNPVFHNHTEHIEINAFFVQEKVMANQLYIYHIPALDQWADVLIKPLCLARFTFLKGKLNVKSFSCEKKSSPRVWGGLLV